MIDKASLLEEILFRIEMFNREIKKTQSEKLRARRDELARLLRYIEDGLFDVEIGGEKKSTD